MRTIIKFLSNEHIQERELAVSLLYELSEYEPVCERIGAVYGAILLLVGMGSSKSEKYDTNIKQMAENGRLQPLLTKLLQGLHHYLHFASPCTVWSSVLNCKRGINLEII